MTRLRVLKEFENIYKGKRPIAVLGSGPSLPSALKKLPEDAVKIAVNYRPRTITDVDITVSMDAETSAEIWKVRKPDELILSTVRDYSDIQLMNRIAPHYVADPLWKDNFSSTLATSLACYMGGNPVLLLGMDLYTGESYFNSKEKHHFQEVGVDPQIEMWKRAFKKCINSERIKAIENPLVDIFGEWRG